MHQSKYESVQKRALKIIYPLLFYEDALSATRLDTLESRRHACVKFADKMRCDNQIGINSLASFEIRYCHCTGEFLNQA